MSIIEQKLADAYAVLVMAGKYIIKESDRINSSQLLVPVKLANNVEIRVAEKTIEKLS